MNDMINLPIFKRLSIVTARIINTMAIAPAKFTVAACLLE
jgi:hypothetical protein